MTDTVAIHVRERGEDGSPPDVYTILAISASCLTQMFTDLEYPSRGRSISPTRVSSGNSECAVFGRFGCFRNHRFRVVLETSTEG
jgi:hypothetical protein